MAGPEIVWPSRHFLAEPRLSRSGRTLLLGCVCGWAECWPLAARVEVTSDSVTWHDWRSGGRDWDLAALGIMVFDRRYYEQALQGIASM